MKALLNKSLPGASGRKNGFTVWELLVALVVLSAVSSFTIANFPMGPFKAEVRDTAFMNRLKGAILEQRIRCVKEPGIGYNFILDGSGSVRFQRQGSVYLKLDDPAYRAYIQKGVWSGVVTLWDFTSCTMQGTNGFTISVYKDGRLLGRLIFQVATSTFREEYYGS